MENFPSIAQADLHIISRTLAVCDVTTVTVVNAGHNLFMSSPEVTAAIQQFMRGETITDSEITIDLPAFVDG